MVRYHNVSDLQTKALFRNGASVHVASSKQLCDGIYKRLCLQRFFTHHTVERVTVNQFLSMLAVARLRQYDKAA